MKCLTLTQPWATLVALGLKGVETRSWSTDYRGPLAIHAAKGYPGYAKDFTRSCLNNGWLLNSHFPLPLGEVVAITQLVDVISAEQAIQDRRVALSERHFGDFSPGRFAWLLDGVQVLAEPVPARGALGLWEWERPS